MSTAVAIGVRLLDLFGVKLSPFIVGAILSAALALGAGGLALHIYNAGWNNADALWQAKALQSQIDALTADRDLARRALGDARLRVATIELQSNADKEGTAVYVDQLQKNFAAACALDDADIEFLRKGTGPGRARARTPAGGRWPFQRNPSP